MEKAGAGQEKAARGWCRGAWRPWTAGLSELCLHKINMLCIPSSHQTHSAFTTKPSTFFLAFPPKTFSLCHFSGVRATVSPSLSVWTDGRQVFHARKLFLWGCTKVGMSVLLHVPLSRVPSFGTSCIQGMDGAQ